MLGFLLQFCLSSLSYSFLFPWHGRGSACTGTGCLGFLAWKPCSLLASAVRGICCVESVVFPLWSGFHLWNSLLSRVTGFVSASPPLKPRSSRAKTEDPVLSVRLVFHGHVVASVASLPQTPPHQTGKYQPNCLDTVNHFLPAGAASTPMCFYLWNYNCPFFPDLHEMAKTTELEQPLQTERSWCNYVFICMQNMGKHVGAVNDPTWANQVIRQDLVISCNHKTCQGRVFLSLW